MNNNGPDPKLDFNFDNNPNADSTTHLSYSEDVSPPHSPSSLQDTYTPPDDTDIDAIRTVPSSRPTLHNLRILSSSHAVPANKSDDRGGYKAFMPINPQKPARKPGSHLTKIYASSEAHPEKEPAVNRDLHQDSDPLKVQKQIRNLLALVVILLVVIIVMLIPIIYLSARTWVFASSNVSEFTAAGQGPSRGLPGLISDIVTRAANETKAEVSIGGWAQDMSVWANATSAQLKEMDKGGLNDMVKSAVGGVDGVNKRLDGIMEKMVVIGFNGTGEIWAD
jgi:hypothetical protein